MDFDDYREFLLAKKGVTEEQPFGPDVIVYKVMGKMFAMLAPDARKLKVSLKNTIEKNIALRELHEGIEGAYHMNKAHWSSFDMSFNIPSQLLLDCTTDSYDLVVKGLSKALKAELAKL